MSEIQELNIKQISQVSAGSRLRSGSITTISRDAMYGGALTGAAFFAGALFIPGIGTIVALTAFTASLTASGIAISVGTR